MGPTVNQLIDELIELQKQGHGDVKFNVYVDHFHSAFIDEKLSYNPDINEVEMSIRGL